MSRKFKFFSVTVLLILLSTLTLMAQDNPCDPDQVDGCPLDNWVIVLVVAAVIFVTYRLYRKQRGVV